MIQSIEYFLQSYLFIFLFFSMSFSLYDVTYISISFLSSRMTLLELLVCALLISSCARDVSDHLMWKFTYVCNIIYSRVQKKLPLHTWEFSIIIFSIQRQIFLRFLSVVKYTVENIVCQKFLTKHNYTGWQTRWYYYHSCISSTI